MKIKRQKQAKKTLSFYKYNFNFREPFQILIDGTFCQAALKNKIQIKEQLPKYLMGEIQLCTTKWVTPNFASMQSHNSANFRANRWRCSFAAVLWRSWRLWVKICMEPNSSCRGSKCESVPTLRAPSLRLSVCCPCWRKQTLTTTLLLHRYAACVHLVCGVQYTACSVYGLQPYKIWCR